MDNMLTTHEAAAFARVSVGTIVRWCKLGYLGKDVQRQSVTKGSRCGYSIRESMLERYLYKG